MYIFRNKKASLIIFNGQWYNGCCNVYRWSWLQNVTCWYQLQISPLNSSFAQELCFLYWTCYQSLQTHQARLAYYSRCFTVSYACVSWLIARSRTWEEKNYVRTAGTWITACSSVILARTSGCFHCHARHCKNDYRYVYLADVRLYLCKVRNSTELLNMLHEVTSRHEVDMVCSLQRLIYLKLKCCGDHLYYYCTILGPTHGPNHLLNP